MNPKLQIAAAILLPNIGGFVNGKITANNLRPWYESIKKPSFNPPNWVFAPMWTSIYSGMGYASYLVYKEGNGFSDETTKLALTLYGTQLALNWAWSPLFFKYHSFKWSLVDALVLYGTSIACGVAFYKINPVAGYLFVPYVAWLSYATVLNYSLYKLNTTKNDE